MYKAFTLSEIITITNAIVDYKYDNSVEIDNLTSLELSNEKSLTFFAPSLLAGLKYKESLITCKAAACLVDKNNAHHIPQHIIPLIVEHPLIALQNIGYLFYDVEKKPEQSNSMMALENIDESSIIGENCFIERGVVIKQNTTIGNNCWIKSNSVIGPNVSIGNDCIIYSNVSLSNTIVGNRVCIKSGAVIGNDGFGFANHDDNVIDAPHFGKVVIENNTTIGSNTCIDRGMFTNTIIGSNTRIDNLCQIGHNVIIGDHVIICGHCGIAGSVIIEDRCCIGGKVGIVGHITLGKGTMVAAMSGVSKSVSPGSIIAGIPAIPIREWQRSVANRYKKKSV